MGSVRAKAMNFCNSAQNSLSSCVKFLPVGRNLSVKLWRRLLWAFFFFFL